MTRLRAAVMALGLAVAIMWLFPPIPHRPEERGVPDSLSYFAIAEGRQTAAYYYYAGRVLHPWTARATHHLGGISIEEAFRGVSVAALAVLLLSVALRTACAWILPCMITPTVMNAFGYYYIPDLFYAALSSVYFLVSAVSPFSSLPLLFLLHLSRESTMLLSLGAVVLAWRTDRPLAFGTAGVAAVGLGVGAWFVSQGLPNQHGMSTLVFNVAKVFYNVAANTLGVVLWTDTNATTTGCEPVVTMPVRWWSIKLVGLCSYQWQRPFTTVVALASAFGVLPSLLWARRANLFHRTDLRLPTAVGLMGLIMAPLIGGTVDRYVLYAWPLFWITGASLLLQLAPRRRMLLVILSIAASWTPTLVGTLAALPVLSVLYWTAASVLRAADRSQTTLGSADLGWVMGRRKAEDPQT